MYIEIPATTVKSRNLQELLQELAGICRNVRNLQEYQEFAGMSGEWHPCTGLSIIFIYTPHIPKGFLKPIHVSGYVFPLTFFKRIYFSVHLVPRPMSLEPETQKLDEFRHGSGRGLIHPHVIYRCPCQSLKESSSIMIITQIMGSGKQLISSQPFIA